MWLETECCCRPSQRRETFTATSPAYLWWELVTKKIDFLWRTPFRSCYVSVIRHCQHPHILHSQCRCCGNNKYYSVSLMEKCCIVSHRITHKISTVKTQLLWGEWVWIQKKILVYFLSLRGFVAVCWIVNGGKDWMTMARMKWHTQIENIFQVWAVDSVPVVTSRLREAWKDRTGIHRNATQHVGEDWIGGMFRLLTQIFPYILFHRLLKARRQTHWQGKYHSTCDCLVCLVWKAPPHQALSALSGGERRSRTERIC